MMRLKLLGTALIALSLTTFACNKDKGKGDSAGGKKKGSAASGHTVWGTEDLASKLKLLQGKTTVRIYAPGMFKIKGPRAVREDVVFELKGDALTATAAKGETIKGTLKMKSPCGLTFLVDGKPKSGYDLAINGKDVYFGLGGAGVKLSNGKWLVCEDMGNYIVWDGKTCTLHKENRFRRTKWKTQPAKCSMEGNVFKYQIPKFMKKGEFKNKTLKVVGNALLSDQMLKDHKVKR